MRSFTLMLLAILLVGYADQAERPQNVSCENATVEDSGCVQDTDVRGAYAVDMVVWRAGSERAKFDEDYLRERRRRRTSIL